MSGSSRAPADLSYPPQVVREYAFLGDGYRGALIGPRGDVGWLCAPTWDSPPALARLIGGDGVYAVTPHDPFVWGGSYEPGTLIWRSRWTTAQARLECREALACPSDPHRLVLLRRIRPLYGPCSVDIVLQVADGFERSPLSARRDDSGAWVLESGTRRARWTGAQDAQLGRDGVLRLHLDVAQGEHHDLVLEISDRALPELPDPARLWTTTESYWHDTVPAFESSAAPRDAQHAYAVLRGLTAPGGGGMVAAATLGMPERVEAGRNYDYRYVWLRDQAYAGLAVAVDHPDPLMDEAVALSTARVLEHGPDLAPAYRLDGRLPPRERDLDLPGYPGGKVVAGNWVRGQFQLDVCGELLQLYAASARHDHLTADDVRAVTQVVDIIQRRWNEPDAGVWELDDAWWTQSRLACVAGLRVAADQLSGREAGRLVSLADAIMAETSRRCLAPDGSWQRAPGIAGVDASMLLAPVRGALAPSDPRSVATLAAVSRDLVEDGYVYRYQPDDRPLGEAEGAFLMCGFAMSLANLAAGDRVEAFRWFERQRASCGPAGLLSEEFDVRERQLRGNLPQGFVHALLLESAQRLGATDGAPGSD
ncbi:glycoside hydrolase family 15 protein [Nostocoides sp. Soil756]|uniref:glycoside hydrolase family 15 protein n=1 Tax=Nostocoides sp. Soil756 TaxID=1736399 RepID=UPI0006F3A05E|nr:glycoside hydrolase family 15 protein [Tetrasphaera sp. Soil756]KRE63725.1 glycoside hydrolase [Tetrasphaera sp. Soil756]